MNQREFQQSFSDYLLRRTDKHEIPNLKKYQGREQEARLSVYRNNVFSSLIDVLANTYPAIRSAIGATLFRYAAVSFISQHPPKSAVMLDYGETFSDFIRSYPHTQQLLYLGDLAHYEYQLHRAYYAADMPTLDSTCFAGLDLSTLSTSTVVFHPSTALLSSKFSIYSIKQHIDTHKSAPPDSETQTPEFILVTRPEYSIDSYAIHAAQFYFLEQLTNGHTIASALEHSIEYAENQNVEFQPAETIQFLIESRICQQLKMPT